MKQELIDAAIDLADKAVEWKRHRDAWVRGEKWALDKVHPPKISDMEIAIDLYQQLKEPEGFIFSDEAKSLLERAQVGDVAAMKEYLDRATAEFMEIERRAGPRTGVPWRFEEVRIGNSFYLIDEGGTVNFVFKYTKVGPGNASCPACITGMQPDRYHAIGLKAHVLLA